jgi:hypothetical protein
MVLFQYMYQFHTNFSQWELHILGLGIIYLWYKNDINRYYLKMTPAEFCIEKY